MWSSTMGVVAAATLAVAAGRPTLTNITRADEILVTIPHLGQVAGRPADHASGVAFFGGTSLFFFRLMLYDKGVAVVP